MNDGPAGVARHFPGEAIDVADPAFRSRMIGRLLEDGDRADLAWLAGVVAAREIEAWFDRHGARRLSRRSRAFWAAALARDRPAPPTVAEALWPLA